MVINSKSLLLKGCGTVDPLLILYLWAGVGNALDNLWGGIEWRATEGIQTVLLIEHIGQTEVSDLGMWK